MCLRDQPGHQPRRRQRVLAHDFAVNVGHERRRLGLEIEQALAKPDAALVRLMDPGAARTRRMAMSRIEWTEAERANLAATMDMLRNMANAPSRPDEEGQTK